MYNVKLISGTVLKKIEFSTNMILKKIEKLNQISLSLKFHSLPIEKLVAQDFLQALLRIPVSRLFNDFCRQSRQRITRDRETTR